MPAPPAPDTSTATTRAGTLALAAGLTVVGVTSITGASAAVSALAFAAWAAAPYAALWTVSRLTGSPWTIGGAGLAALVLEVAIRLTVFVVPRGSTAAVALVFSPAVIGVVAMPAGAALGWLAGRLWPRGPLVRAGVVIATLGLAAWTLVGIAWPEQLPTARLARQRALDAIGAPRVVTGQDAWTAHPIPDASAWPLAVDVDGNGDDELATVSGGTIAIRRLPSLDVVARHTLARPSSWRWYSRLAPIGDALVVVATGGGFQETRVTDLDDRERWRYHPDATLPPTSLYPADLDADGATEFYATTATALVRLDDAGREQWRREVPQLYPLGTLAPASGKTGLVAAAEYRSTVHVWRADGSPAGTLPWPADSTPLRLAEGPGGPVLLMLDTGCEAPPDCGVRAVGLDGRVRWRLDAAPSMRPVDVVTLRGPDPARPRRVLVSAAARDVGRARLQIVDGDAGVVYDEVLAATPRVVVVRTRQGDHLLVQAGDRLALLAPAARTP